MSCAESESFALQVIGDSMAPEFNDGVVIIIEPGAPIDHGCFVVAQTDDELLLRKLIRVNEHWTLKPLNKKYGDIKINDLDSIRGRVIQKSGKRRRDHKWYI